MKLERICLNNWRSFYGVNNILISIDDKKNVTLIRAENGVGKTSFLAALNWCFYGILPNESEFENPTELVNKYAIQKDKVDQTWVEVDFEHQGSRYRAKRHYTQSSKHMGAIGIERLGEGGEVPVSSNINKDRFINSVMPKEMAPHFFFYGESTGRYTGTTGSREFGRAVKGILGSTVARMTLTDLNKVMGDFRKEAADTTSEDAKKVEAQIAKYSENIQSYRQNIERFEQETIKSKEMRSKLDGELSGFEQTKADQQARLRLETQHNNKKGSLHSAEKERKRWLQKYGTAILASELIAEARAVAESEDTRGKIPAPYNEQFVDKVLSDEKCICGADITVGTPAHERIKDMLQNAGDQVVESRVIHVKTMLGRLEGASSGAWDAKASQDKRIGEYEAECRRLSAEIEEISKRLQANPEKDIANLEAARNKHDNIISNANRSIGQHRQRIRDTEGYKSAKETELQKLLRESANARRFVKRAQLAAALTARLSSKLDHEEKHAREIIAREIDAIVQSVMRKDVEIDLDKNYQLKMLVDGDDVAKSTGENQLLGLAFTAAIAKYAKDRLNSEDDILLPGTVAPLVVDSPFGHLDPTYKMSVAEFLPRLASQVILLVSTSQASAQVMEQLKEYIGSEYVLTRHNLANRGDKHDENIEIDGKHYDLTRYDSSFDGTKIQEVRRKS